MSPGLGAALVGLTWAAALGLPLVTAALLFLLSENAPNGQLIALCLFGACGGGVLALRTSMRIRSTVQRTRAEIMARLRNVGSPEEARRAVRMAAVFAGDPSYATQVEKLSDPEVLELCDEILRRNELGARLHRSP